MKQLGITLLMCVAITGCQTYAGNMRYVEQKESIESALVLESVKVSNTGFLNLVAHRYEFGPEYEAPVKKSSSSTANHPAYEVDKTLAKRTGAMQWEAVPNGNYSVVVQIEKEPPETYGVSVGSAFLNLQQDLSKYTSKPIRIRVECPSCASAPPSQILASYKNGYVGKPVILTYNPNWKLEKERAEKRELAEFDKEQREFAKRAQQEQARIAREGDGSPEDKTCQKYGFKPSTQGYASCRLQIDQARQQLAQQQAQQQAAYEAQRQQYEEAKAERDKERKRQQGLKMMELGLGMASGKYNQSNAYGALPPAPTPPSNQPLRTTIQMPNGRFMHCETRGNDTFCF